MLAPIYYVFCQEIDEGLQASSVHATHAVALAPSATADSAAEPVAAPSPSVAPTAALEGGRTSTDAMAWQREGSLPSALAEALEAVEADAFFCFTNLMAEVRDHFCSKLYHTALGITAKISVLEKLIERKDAEVGRLLKRLRVSPSFYGFRWITLLMTQEWELPDVLRLWDSLLADPRRYDFLLYFATATVLSIRDELLEQNDFAFAVKVLQRFEARVSMHVLLAKAHELYREDHPPPQPQRAETSRG